MMSLLVLAVGVWLLIRFSCDDVTVACVKGYQAWQFMATLMIAAGILACALFLCVVIVHGLHAGRMNRLRLEIGHERVPPIESTPAPVMVRGDAYLMFALTCIFAALGGLIALVALTGADYVSGVVTGLVIMTGLTVVAGTILMVAAVRTKSVGSAMWSRWQKEIA